MAVSEIKEQSVPLYWRLLPFMMQKNPISNRITYVKNEAKELEGHSNKEELLL